MKPQTNPKRLYSLDALRGFDMFWIIGGEGIFIALASLTGWPFLKWWAGQLEHVEWHGFVFYDMIFPLFLFIAGISFPFSLAKRTAANHSRASIYKHVFFRGLILVLLGILYNNGLRFDFGELRYGSVLGRIGLAWMFAALIFMNTKLNSRILLCAAILLGYWVLMLLFPAPDAGTADIFSREGNFASWVDRMLMPGRLYLGNHDPEGIMSTLPAISTALLGMFTGEFIMSDRLSHKPLRKVLIITGAAVALMIIGKLWNIVFPINKNLWTSSFVCWAGGLSLLLFALFHLIIDVWKFRKWAFFFVVIGMNPITIYLTERIVNFRAANNFFFKDLAELAPERWTPLIMAVGITAIAWLFLYFLYKKKIFLKV
jgi:predicted acyltransferase